MFYQYLIIIIKLDEIFRSDLMYTVEKFFNGKAMFLKFFVFFELLQNSPYVLSDMPGIKEGLSGSTVVGYNVGIKNGIDTGKRKAAIKAIKCMTFKECQKPLVIKELIISGISSLYDDEEVCSTINNCKFYKNVQTVLKPVDKVDDFSEYSEKFTNFFFEYLYGNETEKNALKKNK